MLMRIIYQFILLHIFLYTLNNVLNYKYFEFFIFVRIILEYHIE
jgi:hypothetical protein